MVATVINDHLLNVKRTIDKHCILMTNPHNPEHVAKIMLNCGIKLGILQNLLDIIRLQLIITHHHHIIRSNVTIKSSGAKRVEGGAFHTVEMSARLESAQSGLSGWNRYVWTNFIPEMAGDNMDDKDIVEDDEGVVENVDEGMNFGGRGSGGGIWTEAIEAPEAKGLNDSEDSS